MIDRTQVIPDRLSDEIGKLIQRLTLAAPGHAREAARKELLDSATAAGYITFVGHHRRYQSPCMGSSFLFRVPNNRRGHLRTFRGRLIRICCWHRGGQFDRKLMAGVADDSQIALSDDAEDSEILEGNGR